MASFLIEAEGLTEEGVRNMMDDWFHGDFKVQRAVKTKKWRNELFSVNMADTKRTPEGWISYSSRSGVKSYGTMKQAKQHAEYDIVNLFAVIAENDA